MTAKMAAIGNIAQSNSTCFKYLMLSFVNKVGTVKIQPKVRCEKEKKSATVKIIPTHTPKSLIVGTANINLVKMHKAGAIIYRTNPCS